MPKLAGNVLWLTVTVSTTQGMLAIGFEGSTGFTSLQASTLVGIYIEALWDFKIHPKTVSNQQYCE